MRYKLFLDDLRTLEQAYKMTNDDSYDCESVVVTNFDEFDSRIKELIESKSYKLGGDYHLHGWVIVRNYNEFTDTITEMFKRGYFPSLCSYDHDLGKEHIEYYFNNGGHENPPDPLDAEFTEKTGYDCCKWLVDFCIDNKLELPKYKVHSKNPVGKENILSYFDNYLKHSKK